MNTKATAKQIMSAMQSDAFNLEACVKILRDRINEQPRIYTRCPACFNDTLTINKGHLLCTWLECPNPTLIDSAQPAGAAQPEPESWQEIAREAARVFCVYHTNITTRWAQGCLEQAFYDAIERSHAAQPRTCDQCSRKLEDGALYEDHTAQPQHICPDCKVERADYEGKPDKYLENCPNCDSKAQPQRSNHPPAKATDDNQEEWRVIENSVGTWDIYSGDHKIADDISLKATAEWICAEFHAALDAERVIHSNLHVAINELQQELAAERRRREQAERMLDLAGGQNWGIDNLKNLDELHGTVIKLRNKVVESDQQLLSALAAIEKHNKRAQWPNCYKIDVDLSALREHDAEVRKPLVEALEAIPAMLDTMPVRTGAHNIRKHISDALAKLKQGK